MYGMSLGLPLTMATVIGGWLVDAYNWRYVFLSYRRYAWRPL